jgi:MFS family permease
MKNPDGGFVFISTNMKVHMKSEKQASLWTRDFTILCVANFLMSTAFYFLLPTLPVYFVKELGAGGVQTGYLLAAYTLSALIIRPFAGFSVDFFGRKTLYLGSFILFALLFGMYGFAEGILLMLVLRFLHGISWAGVTTAGSTLVVDLVPPKRRGEGLGIFGMAMTSAMAVGPALGLIILQHYDFRILFISASVLCFTGLIAALFVSYPVFTRSESNGGFQLSTLFEKSSIPMSLGILLLMIPYGGVISFIALYASEHNLGNAGSFFVIFAIGIGITRIISGKIFDKSGPDTLIYLSSVSFIIGYLVLAFYKSPVGFYGSALLIGISNGIVFPVFQAMVNNLVPVHRRGAANSTLFTALDLGIGLGMVLMGWVYDMFNLTTVYAISALLVLVAAGVYYFYVKPNYHSSLSLLEKD